MFNATGAKRYFSWGIVPAMVLVLGFTATVAATGHGSPFAFASLIDSPNSLKPTDGGGELIINLDPSSASNLLGTDHTLTATVTTTGAEPAEGVVVDFAVISGPTTGATGSDTTDVFGEANFTYTGASPGIDTIEACINNHQGGHVCAQAIKEWTPPSSGCSRSIPGT